MATSSLGTKTHLSAEKAAEVSPCSSFHSGAWGDRGRDGRTHGAKSLVLQKELTVTGPPRCGPALCSRWQHCRQQAQRGRKGKVYYLHV